MNDLNDEQKRSVILLKTAKGQMDAVIKMIEDGRYCVDVSNQILAAKGLLEKANLNILEQHLKHCVKEGILEGKGDEKIEEILSIFAKYLK